MGRVTGTVVAALALVATGVAARGLIVSPEEARLPVPEAQAVYVVVESGSLTRTFSGTGSIEVATVSEVTPIPGRSEGMSVVSGVPLRPGDAVRFCQPLVEISGRPLLALHGPVVAYRDLGEGDAGDDVARLQQALAECGYSAAIDGDFGQQTTTAVRQMYADAGYSAVTRADSTEVPTDVAAHAPSGGASLTDVASPRTEVVVPYAEVAYLPAGGWIRSAADLSTPVGGSPIVTVDHGNLQFHIDLPAVAKLAVAEGESITVNLGGTEVKLELPELPVLATIDQGEPVYPVDIALDQGTDRALAGTTASYVITVGDDTDYSLVVPATAVYSRAGGSAVVLLNRTADPEGVGTVEVPVTVVAIGDGYAAIEGDLVAGDHVQVGWQ